jgi:hypothetical protein
MLASLGKHIGVAKVLVNAGVNMEVQCSKVRRML